MPARAVGFGFLAGLVVLLVTCLSGAALYVRSVQALKSEVRANLIRTATVAAAMVDGDAHRTFTSPKQETTTAYFHAIEPLSRVEKASGDIKYVYTCVLKQDKVYFILDPTPAGDHDGNGVDDKSHIMQPYPEADAEMKTALRTGTPQADRETTADQWGNFMSSYAPIHDSHGQVVGIVGVDLTADKYLARLTAMRRAAVTGLTLAVALALLIGMGVCFAQGRVLQSAASLRRAHDHLEERVAVRTSELADANFRLNQAYTATIEGWSRALDLRDEETQGHSKRVTELTLRLARSFGLTEGELTNIERGALLHDIGKMAVPDHILRKPGPLTDKEWEIMRLHPVHAHEMLSPITFLLPALEIPFCHHEKWDGTGYPSGLKGEEIPLFARLFAIVDVWDALCSDRPYRQAWATERVLDHLRNLSGTHFDPAVVQAFLALMQENDVPQVCEALLLAA
jgi:putative nucleotidyltransferase with HDIG domain